MTITDFLGQFYPDIDEPIWFRSFDAKKIPNELRSHVQKIGLSRRQLREDKSLQSRLKTINKTQGIYFVVNAGGNSDTDIKRINAVFCEIDDRPLVEQNDLYENGNHWIPSTRVQTKKSVHAYYLLENPIDCDQFLNVQQGLIKHFKSDPAISNLARVMRVPGFNHVSYDNGYKFQIVECISVLPHRYTLAELQEHFPYQKPKPVQAKWETAPISGRLETLDDVKAELRRRVMDSESWKAHGQWGSANAKCHNGEGDTGMRVHLASGTVTCWSDCSLKAILEAYGLELPNARKFEYLPRREQKSELYQWYQERKRI